LVLSYRYLNRETGVYSEEAKTHKEIALKMLKDVESATEDTNLEPTLLDAVLILTTLDGSFILLRDFLPH
jgi:citrate synthase